LEALREQVKSKARFIVFGAAVATAAMLATVLSQKEIVHSDTGQNIVMPTQLKTIHAEATLVCQEGAEVTLGSQLAGQVRHVYVKEGDTVHAGELLIDLESSEEQAELAEAEARVVQGDAQQRYQNARLDRAKQLSSAGTVSRDQFDHVQYDADEANSEVGITRGVMARLTAQLRKTRINAPFDGVVVRRLVNDQEAVNPGSPVLRIADLTRTLVEAQVDELDAPRIQMGAKTLIGIEGYPDQSFPGEVVYIAPELGPRTELSNDPAQPDRSEVLQVRIKMLGPTPFKLRQRLEVAIQADPDPIAKNLPLLDQSAIH
jgi:multidrug efflux pump subunit AcrA (membrane-fusion protein)